jgi:hypothetical protein
LAAVHVTWKVCRNRHRFPPDFVFEINEIERKNLMSQFAISSWRGYRKPPTAFTEHGAIMAATVLNSPRDPGADGAAGAKVVADRFYGGPRQGSVIQPRRFRIVPFCPERLDGSSTAAPKSAYTPSRAGLNTLAVVLYDLDRIGFDQLAMPGFSSRPIVAFCSANPATGGFAGGSAMRRKGKQHQDNPQHRGRFG